MWIYNWRMRDILRNPNRHRKPFHDGRGSIRSRYVPTNLASDKIVPFGIRKRRRLSLIHSAMQCNDTMNSANQIATQKAPASSAVLARFVPY